MQYIAIFQFKYFYKFWNKLLRRQTEQDDHNEIQFAAAKNKRAEHIANRNRSEFLPNLTASWFYEKKVFLFF